MHKNRVCPICYGKVHSESWGELNEKTGWFDRVYSARCPRCLTKVEGKIPEALDLFPTVEAEEVDITEEDTPVYLTGGLGPASIPTITLSKEYIVGIKKYLTGLNDRNSGE